MSKFWEIKKLDYYFTAIELKHHLPMLDKYSTDDIVNHLLKDYIAKKKNEDPIVLLPVMVEMLDQIGFIVISKWGIESNDIDLQVDINN